MLYSGILLTKDRMNHYLNCAKTSIKNKPAGCLKVIKNKGCTQYIHHENGFQKYIPKSNEDLIRNLAQKEYDKKVIHVLETEMVRLNKYLAKTNLSTLTNIYNNIDLEKQQFVKPYEVDDRHFLEQWKNVYNPGNPNFSIDSNLITEKGEKVRSKSELEIANILFKRDILYRYEFPLYISNFGDCIHPDFTVLNKRTRKEYYLEYFGMMDDAHYRNNAFHRIEQYASEGIMLGDSLIVIFGERYTQLNVVYFEKLVEHFFV